MSTPPTPPKRVRIRRTPDQWQSLLERFAQSGQTRDHFCQEHDLSLSSFSRWRTKLRSLPSQSPNESLRFAELTPEVHSETPSTPAWNIELQLGEGVFLRLRRPC